MEWISKKLPLKTVIIMFDTSSKFIKILNFDGTILRIIDLNKADYILYIYFISDNNKICLKLKNDYDLVNFEICLYFIMLYFISSLKMYFSSRYNSGITIRK